MAAHISSLSEHLEPSNMDAVLDTTTGGSTHESNGTTEVPHEHFETLSISTGMLIFSMILYMSFGTKLAHSVKFVGEGMSAVFTGLALGGVLMAIGNILLTQETVEKLLTFDHSSFFTFYLPPIILFAGLSVRKKAFFRNLPTIAAMGIVGTYIAFAFIAGLLAIFAKFISGITLADCLALGAIFATTDSVAVLQVLEQDRAPLLFSLVFGEGVINDATTVALLRTVQGLGPAPSMGIRTVAIIFGKFIWLFALSMVMGLAFGFASSLLLKKFPATGTPQAVGLIGTTAYFSYLMGDHLKLSGIVTLFCCSVTMSHYAMHNLTKTQRAACMSAFETLSYFSEGSIFVYVGLDCLDPATWRYTYVGRALGLSVICIVLLLLSRAIFSFPILLTHNYFATEKINVREMIIAWWAGAMRGAVSVALVYYYYADSDDGEASRDHATLISMTLVAVLVSTLAFGAVTKPLLDFMLGTEEHAGSHTASEGLEMVPHHGNSGPGGHAALKAKAPHAVIDMPDNDDGYETDATAFTDAGYTTEEDGQDDFRPIGRSKRGRRIAAGSNFIDDDREGEQSELLTEERRAGLERLTSLLKGTAPAALVASPGGSPKADETGPWQAFTDVDIATPSGTAALTGQPGGPPGMSSGMGPAGLRDASPRRHHVTFADAPGAQRRLEADAMSQASFASAPARPLRRTNSADALDKATAFRSRLRLPARFRRSPEVPGRPRVRKESQQLAEWWADFDERYMKPMFNRPGDGESWTPTSPEARHAKMGQKSASVSPSPAASPKPMSRPGARPAGHQTSRAASSHQAARTASTSAARAAPHAPGALPSLILRASSTPTFAGNHGQPDSSPDLLEWPADDDNQQPR